MVFLYMYSFLKAVFLWVLFALICSPGIAFLCVFGRENAGAHDSVLLDAGINKRATSMSNYVRENLQPCIGTTLI